jgi:hypothetical protein
MAAPRPLSSTEAAELIRLQRSREHAATKERLMRLEARQRAEEEERRLHAEEAERRHQRELQSQRLRAEAAANRSRVAAASVASRGPYSQFTPPQAFISGGAATRIAGAPALLDVVIALAAGAVSSAWVVTRDHSAGADLGWSAFLLLLGVGLMVEGHGELHDAGVGTAGAQAGYIAARLLGGTQQPGA